MAGLLWLLVACGASDDPRPAVDDDAPNVVTADIQAGIEAHIEEQCRIGDGFLRLAHGDGELRLRLVRVHTEYLATLGPRRHFACVDMVDVGGDFYDVDFFLSGEPNSMTVTETTVHKLNGQPYYAWEQKPDKSWQRVPVENAADHLLGVRTGKDAFRFQYTAKLPEITGAARVWIPLPSSDGFQTIEVLSIDLPTDHRVLEDRAYGNRVLYFEAGPDSSHRELEVRFDVRREEKAAFVEPDVDLERFLKPERLVPPGEMFQVAAAAAVAGKTGEVERARALYDHVIDRMRYAKTGVGWGQGDAVYACDAGSGNCTDFHAYFIALARSVGIPARFGIGASIPSERDEGGIGGYHCWAEFHADGRWWPVDISEADKCSNLAGYYFGHQPANRIELSRGRDLVVEPGPASGPINFLAYPILEIDGKPTKMAKVAFLFERTATDS